MRDAARAVVGDPVLVGARPHGDVEECRHVVDGIVEAAGLLQSGAPAEVDEPARHRGGPAPATGSLEHQDVGTGRRGLNRGGSAFGRFGEITPTSIITIAVVRIEVSSTLRKSCQLRLR